VGQASLVCDEPRCRRGTFSEVTAQVPAFARSTARLCQTLVTAVVVSGRAASEVARAHRVSWWLVASMVTAAADVLLPDADQTLVRGSGSMSTATGRCGSSVTSTAVGAVTSRG
jgi:hypothetical protein